MIRTCLVCAWVVCAFASLATAAELTPDERTRMLETARPGLLGLRHAHGGCSAVFIDTEAGLVATVKSHIRGVGALSAFSFEEVTSDDGRRHVKRHELGAAELVAVHSGADVALLKITPGAHQRSLHGAATGNGATGRRYVVSLPSAVAPADARDLDIRAVAEGESPQAAVYLMGAGGAVVAKDGSLLGLAAYDAASDAGSVVPLARVSELVDDGASHGLPPDGRAQFIKESAELPAYLRVSPRPGGPAGKRVGFGGTVFAIKEPRAIVCDGVFILDRHDPLEYVACPVKNGKLHETVIGTTADPALINLALIALKYKSGGGVERLGDSARPFGDGVQMFVEWDHAEARAIAKWLATVDPPWKQPNYAGVVERKEEGVIKWEPGTVVRMRLGDLAFNQAENRPMPNFNWVFTGSTFGRDEDTGRRYYRASVDGVLAAVYRDPVAVFNSPLQSGEDDTTYHVNDAIVPPRGTFCRLIIMPSAPAAN